MTKKTFLISIILLFVSVAFAIWGIVFTNLNEQNNLSGKLVFEQTATQGSDFDKVVIKNANNTATIHLRQGLWHISEANDYYANFALTNALFMNMNQSRYFIEVDTQNKPLEDFKLAAPSAENGANSGTLIQTYAGNQLLDEAIIGKNTDDNLYTYIRRNNDNHVWLINNDYTLPRQLYSWFQQPLLNYASEQIKSITAPNISFSRLTPKEPFSGLTGNKESLTLFTDVFSYLTFQEVIPDNAFDFAAFPLKKDIQITLFNGLVTDITIYTNAEQTDFWVKIKISANRLPTLVVNDYIKNNSFYYDGWLFKLAPETGYILFNTLAKKEQ